MRALYLRQLVLGSLLLCNVGCYANAEVRASGSVQNVLLQTHDATMPEVLAGLQSALHLTFTLTGSTPQTFTGVYSGPVRRVLSRLLDGSDYLIGTRQNEIVITIIRPNAPRSGVISIAQHSPNVSPARVIQLAAEDNNGTQGWVPTEDPFKPYGKAAPAPAAPAAHAEQTRQNSAPAAKPQNDGIQGWVPTEDPYKTPHDAAAAAGVKPPPAKPMQAMPNFGMLQPAGELANPMEENLTGQDGIGHAEMLTPKSRLPNLPTSLMPMPSPLEQGK